MRGYEARHRSAIFQLSVWGAVPTPRCPWVGQTYPRCAGVCSWVGRQLSRLRGRCARPRTSAPRPRPLTGTQPPLPGAQASTTQPHPLPLTVMQNTPCVSEACLWPRGSGNAFSFSHDNDSPLPSLPRDTTWCTLEFICIFIHSSKTLHPLLCAKHTTCSLISPT